MKQLILYSLSLMLLLSACEDVYYPDIDEVENLIVVDARIDMERNNNVIVLSQSKGFNSEQVYYPELSGGSVTIIDDEGKEFNLPEIETGKFYVNFQLQENQQYKIRVEYLSDIFESEFERIPGTPKLDTVYGVAETKILASGGTTNTGDFRKVSGVQIYADMVSTEATPNYRFTAHKVAQSIWSEITDFGDIPHYFWLRSEAAGNFNIAAPPEYSNSKNIVKHPLYFLNRSITVEADHYFMGWILILYQHAISQSTYNYYNDLNAQLHADGRIFDPVYVQARNNFKCVNNPDKTILGNFEILRKTETRYYIRYLSEELGFKVKELSDRSYIPVSGESINEKPPFWAQ